MKHHAWIAFAFAASLAPNVLAEPIALHPDNAHYLLFRGQPTVLVTSGEHYGAVLNLDFDYIPYLDELASKGLNQTRTFSGTYVEVPNSFNIQNNTLSPGPGRFLSPWARSNTAGYAGGGNKFDLTIFSDEYFTRLKDFVAKADERDIVVEFVLFCPLYTDDLWNISPMNAANNVNSVGNVARDQAMTLNNGGLLAYQDAYVEKVVSELAEFDNLYYEIANEPYFGVSDDFQAHILATLTAAEAALPSQHLIAQNFCNDSCDVGVPDDAVSIYNFHYADPPSAVTTNFGHNRVMSYDETGFDGTADLPYRRGAWAFLLAGGAIYSNLDYSFTPDEEDGSFAFTTSPGGGGNALRNQLQILKEFIDEFDFVHMTPDTSVISATPGGATAYALVKPGAAYAVYLKDGSSGDLTLDASAGSYRARWIDTKNGPIDAEEMLEHPGGALTLSVPAYSEDIALDLRTLEEIEANDAMMQMPDAGAPSAGAPSVGGMESGGGGAVAMAGLSAGGEGAGAPAAGGISAATASDDSGCGCRVAERRGTGVLTLASLALAGLLFESRRRRQRVTGRR